MKRYVEQLIEDLEFALGKAGEKLSLFFDSSDNSDYFPITEDEEGGILISDLIGLEKYVFPKVEYLNNSEAQQLSRVMIRVLKEYGLNPIFWKGLTDKIRYGKLREQIDHIVFPEKGSLVDLEMCDYLPVDCSFASHCPVLCKTNKCCGSSRNRA